MEAKDYVEIDLGEWAEKLKAMGLSPEQCNQILAEMGLRMALGKYLRGVTERIKAGETVSIEEAETEMNRIAGEEFGVEHGIPLPPLQDDFVNIPMIYANRAPLSFVRSDRDTEHAQELLRRNIRVINSWTRLRDVEVCIVATEVGPYAISRYLAGTRMRKFLLSMMVRSGAQTAARELKAMDALKPRLSSGQWDSYVLNGAFAERSPRSDLHYIFRKGFPTVVCSYHGEKHAAGGHIITTLCLHPYGYYWGTFTGLMCPTDEVICHLLMMRSDEHDYWKKCGQWPAHDIRSGL